MTQLIVEGLQKRYKSRYVVQDIALKVESGQVVGLLGPNGAGKTTSFYMIVGLVRADAGKITLNQEDISHFPMHNRAKIGLAYLPQEPSIFRKMTTAENILAILQLQKLSPEQQQQRLEELLNDLNISHIRDSLGVSLSGGERRRVEIARCLAANPKFILLDEPFAGIDPIAVIDIQKIIKLLKQRNIGILITDHNVRETLGICDHAYIVNEGKIFASGTPSEIIDNQSVREVYLGRDFRL
jgi:lipopolysaccharide export system ATP-binding protein